MSIQISTRIDETTKQQFDKVCESIGISASNALSMFIKSVINYNGIPFRAVAPKQKTSVIKEIFEEAINSENNLTDADWEEMISVRTKLSRDVKI